jgi:signal transduction histidine kinase
VTARVHRRAPPERRAWVGRVVIVDDDSGVPEGVHAPPDDESQDSVRLVRGVAHDLRQPLATIGALAEAALTHGDLPKPVAEQLRHIVAQVHTAGALVIHLTENRFEPEPIDLRAVVTGVAAHTRLVYPGELHVAIGVEAPVVADRLALSRALANLVDNAMRAAGPAGNIEIRLRRSEGWYAIDVRDSGPGFGVVPPGGGNLGLQIAANVMRAHHGRMEISHRRRGGATVRLSIPATPAQTA